MKFIKLCVITACFAVCSCNQPIIGRYYSIGTDKMYFFVGDSLFIYNKNRLKDKYKYLTKSDSIIFYKRITPKPLHILRLIRRDNFTYEVIYNNYDKKELILKQNI